MELRLLLSDSCIFLSLVFLSSDMAVTSTLECCWLLRWVIHGINVGLYWGCLYWAEPAKCLHTASDKYGWLNKMHTGEQYEVREYTLAHILWLDVKTTTFVCTNTHTHTLLHKNLHVCESEFVLSGRWQSCIYAFVCIVYVRVPVSLCVCICMCVYVGCQTWRAGRGRG